ncbi:MAG: hypothetical protein R2786_01615 [Flavobacteriaceae bacterium]
MRPQIVTIVAFLLFILNSISMLGQSTTASSGPPPPSQGRGPELPIDSSIYILLIAGILYGVYILLKKKKAIDRIP